MNKDELASYLVSLHTLLEAQSKGAHSIPSTVLADEYNRCWDQLKDIINKEQENETRKREFSSRGAETGADLSRGVPRRGVSDRDSRGDIQGS